MSRGAVYLCFFISGFSGLVSEVVWSRLIAYTMGSSQLSIALVVSVFMSGLALGSYVGGSLADRTAAPLRLYGWLVLLAGVLSAAVAPLLWLMEPILGVVYRWNDGAPNHPLFSIATALACTATLLAPTLMMGASLPALVRHLARNDGEVGARLGTLYGINTFGAVAGTAAAGLYLIGRFGLGWTIVIGAGLDVMVGLYVLRRTRGESLHFAARRTATHSAPHASAPLATTAITAPRAARAAIIAFGIAGFANMCLQLGWTRALVIAIGNSTYAFSLILGMFIFGLAAGGWLAGLFADRLKDPVTVFGWLLVATAAAAGFTIPWLGLAPGRFAIDIAATATANQGLDLASFLLTGARSQVLAILPATLLMGMALPLAGRVAAWSGRGVGRAVGSAYAANTLGAILGTALAGFVLIPLFDRVWGVLYFATALTLAGGVIVLCVAPSARRSTRFGLLGATLALLALVGFQTRPHGVFDNGKDERSYWHPSVFAVGVYMDPSSGRGIETSEDFARARIKQFESLYYKDGGIASVAVVRDRTSGHKSLTISGKTDASEGENSVDQPTQLLLGHLPVLAHPNPRRVLTLGLGGGMTLGAMVAHREVEHIDLLELLPEVEEAARRFFATANNNALLDSRVRKIIGDGRNHITHTSARYDIISSEPSNFWIAGLGNLFTEDFYREALERLNDDGIMCQWVYVYSIRLADYQIALRTFNKVFPHVSVWSSALGDTLLLGSRQPIVFDRDRIATGLAQPAARAQLEGIGIATPEDLFRYFQCRGETLANWLGAGATNTDFHPILEYSSPFGFFASDRDIGIKLSAAATSALPTASFRNFSIDQLTRVEARRASGRALQRLKYHMDRAHAEEALSEYAGLLRVEDPWTLDAADRELLGGLQSFRELATRREFLARASAIEHAPDRWKPVFALAMLERELKLLVESLQSVAAAERRGAPASDVLQFRLFTAVTAGMDGQLKFAEDTLRVAIDASTDDDPNRAEAIYNLGFCLEQQSRFDEAELAYLDAMARRSDVARAAGRLNTCLANRQDPSPAVQAARAALSAAMATGTFETERVAAVARSLAAAGRRAEAIQWLAAAVSIAPGRYESELEEWRKAS
ncbi:MAG: fused MFS/spermidine synthase [Planctomycetota bacterium]